MKRMQGEPSVQEGQNRDEPGTDTERLVRICDGDERERIAKIPGEI